MSRCGLQSLFTLAVSSAYLEHSFFIFKSQVWLLADACKIGSLSPVHCPLALPWCSADLSHDLCSEPGLNLHCNMEQIRALINRLMSCCLFVFLNSLFM